MSLTHSLGESLRHVLAALRRRSGRVASLGARYYRGIRYVWDLIVWSRISAGRAGLLPIEFPLDVLARKGITTPPPHFEGGDTPRERVIRRGFAEVYALLFANLQPPNLLSAWRHAIPGPAFRGIYLWDSAFIAQVWKWWDPVVAQEVLLAVVELRDGDRLQHVVSEFTQSRYTQPPLVAWSALEVAAMLEPREAHAFLEQIYTPLKAYHYWLNVHRRLDNGLYFWAHPYESGVENAPRFSNADESVLRNTTTVAAPDLCSYVVLQMEALAVMARQLARPLEAEEFAAAAQQLRARMNDLLWCERDGLYFDLDGAGVPIRVATIASLLPLWAGVPDAAQARRLCARICDPAHFATLIPLPSVDRAESRFEKDMWRGPVWLNTAHGVIQGLLRYGFEREAGELAWRLCHGVYQVFAHEQQIYEFYDPDAFHTRDLRRKRGNLWKAFTLGTGPQRDFVGWTGLVNTLLIEVVLGIRLRAGALCVRPRLPADCGGMTFVLTLPGEWGRLSLQACEHSGCQGVWTHREQVRSFRLAPGEGIELHPHTHDGLEIQGSDPIA